MPSLTIGAAKVSEEWRRNEGRANSAGILLRLNTAHGDVWMWKKMETQDNPIEDGRYLVTLGDCNDCRTPKIAGPDGIPVPDTKRLVSIPDRASLV
jgi:hypothetical protein